MDLQLIEHGSPMYEKMVALRTDILRKPLGLVYTQSQLDSEKSDFLLVGIENNNVLGCCILTILENKQIQLRQMAVANQSQGKGIGTEIVIFAEKTSFQNGFNQIILHARKNAVGFYQKLGYQIFGDEYLEVGIPHNSMKKQLIS